MQEHGRRALYKSKTMQKKGSRRFQNKQAKWKKNIPKGPPKFFVPYFLSSQQLVMEAEAASTEGKEPQASQRRAGSPETQQVNNTCQPSGLTWGLVILPARAQTPLRPQVEATKQHPPGDLSL